MSDEQKSSKKRGPVEGAKYNPNKKTLTDWYNACKAYHELTTKVKVLDFLRSADSGPNFFGTDSEKVGFSKKYKQYKEGKLQPYDSNRKKPSVYPNVEEKLVAYIDLRARYYKRDKCGLSWSLLKVKASKFADDLGIDSFKASDGWLTRTLKRHGKIGINLHGEADDMLPEQRIKIVEDWKKDTFHPLIEKYNVPTNCIYNADQTGLFYQKLPNRIYVDKTQKKSYAGAKQMKDKTRITLMVCTAADGSKVPLSIVGKPAKPVCFRLCENDKPPLAYTSQANAWFDKDVTLWWINNVFIPHHFRKFGVSHCILMLDNCPAHKIEEASVPSWCHIVFLPPNMTSNYQPADMGMIASLKIGYKVNMLSKLLDIFDGEGGFEGAANARRGVRRGQRGLDYGGKATILDAMLILNSIWNIDGRYAKEEGLRRCWRKANILPLDMNTTIDAELGRSHTSIAEKTLKKEDCDQLCQLMSALKVKVTDASLDCEHTAYALQGSFVADIEQFTAEDYNDMIENWICIEDEEEVINAVCEDELEELESNTKPAAGDDAEDDDEPDVQPMEIDTDEANLYSYVDAVEVLGKLQLSARKLRLNEAETVHIDRLLRALHSRNAQKPRRDTTLHAYYPPK
jgi:DDE superfamily endonuclease/Tc5 transposase DNA-binding domain